MQSTQELSVRGLQLALAMKERLSSSEESKVEDVGAMCTTLIALLGNASLEMSFQRRELLKSSINRRYHSLCGPSTPFTLADAPAHCWPIWIRSRVHYDSLSCLFISLSSYMLCTTLTDPVFHPHTPFCFCFSLFFFKFMKTWAPPADKNTCHQT